VNVVSHPNADEGGARWPGPKMQDDRATEGTVASLPEVVGRPGDAADVAVNGR
jgi:hypothetical protein